MGYKKANKLTLNVSALNFNPVDSTTYYFGNCSAMSMVTTANLTKIYIPVNGTLTLADITLYSPTAAGTAEDWTIAIRKNDTTDYTFFTLGANTATRRFYNYSLSIPVSQGDYIEFKTTTPAWVTNPEGTRLWGWVTIQY